MNYFNMSDIYAEEKQEFTPRITFKWKGVGLGTLAGTLTSTMVTLPCVSLSGYFGFLAVTLPCVSFGYFGFALACSFLVFMESACHYSRECRSCSRDAVCAQ